MEPSIISCFSLFRHLIPTVSIWFVLFITVAANEHIILLHFQHFLPFPSLLDFLQDVLAFSQG